jgi:AbrB family looped-hinge helix DNA binding protein
MTQVNTPMPTVKVSRRFQVALPSAARRQLGIEAGDHLLVDVQDGILVLLPSPQDMVEHLAGLHRDLWIGIDTTTYLETERASWND